MQYPHLNYIKYLIVDSHGIDTVPARLVLIELPTPPALHLREIFDELVKGMPEGLRGCMTKACPDHISTHSNFWQWAKNAELHELFLALPHVRDAAKASPEESAAVAQVLALAKFRSARIIVESMLFHNQERESICMDLVAKFGINLDPATMPIYEKYFWNIADIPRIELLEYMTQPAVNDYGRNLAKCVQYNLARTRWELGLDPKVNVADLAEGIIADAFFAYKETIRGKTGFETSRAAKDLAYIIQKYEDIKTNREKAKAETEPALEDGMEELAELLQDVVMSLNEKRHPTVEEIQAEIGVDNFDIAEPGGEPIDEVEA